MTRKEITEWLETSKYEETASHEPLVAVVCVFENLEDRNDYVQIEVEFAVPIKWLVDYMNESSDEKGWTDETVLFWLRNEYTSEDSEPILESAVLENKVAFWKTN